MKEYLSHSEEDTMKIAEEICLSVPGGTVVAFSGGMGMGKTAFVRGALKAYGNDSFVSSPTFFLVHDYGGNPKLYHFDMYRVTDIDDLYSTGFFDYLDRNGIMAIEWSENIPELVTFLPRFCIVEITKTGDQGRIIKYIPQEESAC